MSIRLMTSEEEATYFRHYLGVLRSIRSIGEAVICCYLCPQSLPLLSRQWRRLINHSTFKRWTKITVHKEMLVFCPRHKIAELSPYYYASAGTAYSAEDWKQLQGYTERMRRYYRRRAS